MIRTRVLALTTVALALTSFPARAQNGHALNLTVGDVGVSIGDSHRTVGLRLNFRDRELQEVVGANVTLWYPYGEPTSVVKGLALGSAAWGRAWEVTPGESRSPGSAWALAAT